MKSNSILFCLLFAIAANTFTVAKAQVNTSDSLALVDFYNSTNGPDWINNYNWLTTNPVSTWYGITVTGNRVTSVQLPYINLNGIIPASFGNLTNLTYLNVFDNELTGTIPASVGNLTNLTYLNVFDNELTGTIPASVGNLTKLTFFDLADNHLSGSIPAGVGNFTSLTGLILSQNQLSGSIPAELGKLINLTSLQLDNNQLSGTIPAELGNLTNLPYLQLSSNQLTGTIPAFIGNLTNLTGLYLNNNQLTGTIPVEISKLTKLNALGLGGNQLSGTIPPFISNLTNLYSLYLNNNKLTGTIPAEINNLRNLVNLDLSANQLTGTIPSALNNLKYLADIYLQSNQLTGAIPSSLGYLINLEELYLNDNQLTGTIPSTLGNLRKLINLSLDSNQLSGTVPASFHNLTRLTLFDISHNLLSSFGYTNAALKFNSKISGSVSNNLFTFYELQFIAGKYHNIAYAPQDTILPIHQNGNILSVSAGGTLSNNTYKWFKVGETNFTTIKGDSAFTPLTNGKYYAKVTNAIAAKLTLYTDTINYTMPLQNNATTFAVNSVQINKAGNKLLVYPNPAKDVIHVQLNGIAIINVTNSDGKVLLNKNISNNGDINISAFANGIYYIQNKTTGEVKKIVVAH